MEKQHKIYSSAAKERWKFLAQALLKNKPVLKSADLQFSVRNFDGFDLYDKKNNVDHTRYQFKSFPDASPLSVRYHKYKHFLIKLYIYIYIFIFKILKQLSELTSFIEIQVCKW